MNNKQKESYLNWKKKENLLICNIRLESKTYKVKKFKKNEKELILFIKNKEKKKK